MASVINTNVYSINAQRNLNNTQSALQVSLQRLSSGLRINSAKDDAAGLAISERFTAQIRGLNQAIRNSNDGISLAQTAEGAMQEITNNLQRIRELSVQAINASNSTTDRVSVGEEVDALIKEISRVAGTEFNGVSVIATAKTLTFQVGANAGDTIDVSTVNIRAADSTGVGSLLTFSGALNTTAGATVSGFTSLLNIVDTSLDAVNSQRSKFGAVQNRFESVVRNSQNVVENLSASRSRIRDADFAQETANLTRAQILQQAGTSVLAQANAVPQSVLALVG